MTIQVIDTLVTGVWTFDVIYVCSFLVIFIISSIVHGEPGMLAHIPIYLLLVPTMSVLLMIYCLMNMHDQGWGTRDAAPTAGPIIKEGKFTHRT